MSAGRARDNPAGARALRAGGGGGTSDGMDARVARVEAHVEGLRADVADIRANLAALSDRVAALADRVADLTERVAVLTERVAHLPGKGFVITSTTTAVALLTGVIVFGEKLQALVGI